MSGVSVLTAHLDQIFLRGLIVLGCLVSVAASGWGGLLPPVWLVATVGLLSLGFAWAPESAIGTVTLVVVLGWWSTLAEDLVTVGVVLGALGLLTAHVAAVMAAYGSRDLPLDPGVVRTWTWRGGLLFLVVPIVWLAAVAVEGQPEPAGVWMVGGLAALGAIVIASSGFDLYQGKRVE